MRDTYKTTLKVWLYDGPAAWHFVTLTKKDSKEIIELFGDMKRGWGSLPVTVTVGETTWETSIFPDKKTESFLLPLKAAVRKKEGIKEGELVEFSIKIRR